MYNELFRFKSKLELESVIEGLKEATGEEDFLGFEDVENKENYFKKCIRDGFIIERDGYILIMGDVNL